MTFGQLQTRVTTRPMRHALLVSSPPVALLLLAVVGVTLPYYASGLAGDPVLANDGRHGPGTLGGGWEALTVLGLVAVFATPPVLLGVVLLACCLGLVLWSHPRSRAATWTAALPLLSVAVTTVLATHGPVGRAGEWFFSG